MGIRDAVTFYPVLIEEGVRTQPWEYEEGIGSRTAIGQREDGAIVMMVADGRQAYSIGLTYDDVAEVMEMLGCVNAISMDGGNSSCMALGGELVNNPSNIAGGTRDLPTAWLIRKTGNENPEAPMNFAAEAVIGQTDDPAAPKEGQTPCSPELCAEFEQYAENFAWAYYNFLGTQYSDYYYPEVRLFVEPESDLMNRLDQALLDRCWVNSNSNALENGHLIAAFANPDGTYEIRYGLDITEYATYWTCRRPGSVLTIRVFEAPDARYGYYAISTE